ncbi:hypothetical protein [uncultured Nostoc sp.]|uniref:hypothetical protein n=1 Tax=uncultured Nostoc sp. TaxID=340711 RepID=UPI0035CBFAEB
MPNDGVADLLVGQAGYVQAAVNQRIADINLTVRTYTRSTIFSLRDAARWQSLSKSWCSWRLGGSIN